MTLYGADEVNMMLLTQPRQQLSRITGKV